MQQLALEVALKQQSIEKAKFEGKNENERPHVPLLDAVIDRHGSLLPFDLVRMGVGQERDAAKGKAGKHKLVFKLREESPEATHQLVSYDPYYLPYPPHHSPIHKCYQPIVSHRPPPQSLKERLLLKWKQEKEEVEARRAKRKAEAEARIVNKLARVQRQFDHDFANKMAAFRLPKSNQELRLEEL